MFQIMPPARLIFVLVLPLLLGACTSGNTPGNSLFSGDVIRVVEPAAGAPQQSVPVAVQVASYVDQRGTLAADLIGHSNQIVVGLSGHELRVAPDVGMIVRNSMHRQLEQAGFKVSDEQAQFELSGVIRKLRYDVKVRDEIELAVESTLTERASGKVVWSGLVEDKQERFAGVSGNTKQDIANYLRERLGVLAGKTVESISSTLMATRPALFQLVPGTHPIQGVTVLSVPAPAMPVAAPAQSAVQPALGVLQLSSRPARARVYVDGIYYGLTPLRLELPVGIHEVSVQQDGYRERSEKVAIRQGETTELDATLRH